MPEKGKIDGSVLTSVGEIFLWPALAFGAKALDEGHKATISHGNTTIEIKDINPDDEEEKEEE